MTTALPLPHRAPRWVALWVVMAGHAAALLALATMVRAELPVADVARGPRAALLVVVRLVPSMPAAVPAARPDSDLRTAAVPAALRASDRAAAASRSPQAAAPAPSAELPAASTAPGAADHAVSPASLLESASAPDRAPAVAATVFAAWLPGAAVAPIAAAPQRQPAGHAACSRAPYPAPLRERGIEGLLRLRVLVAADGTPLQVRLQASSGWRLFDEAALAQARGCRFHPARLAGEPVEDWVEFPVRFALDG